MRTITVLGMVLLVIPGCAGVVAGLAVLGLGYLWLRSLGDDDDDQHFYDYGY